MSTFLAIENGLLTHQSEDENAVEKDNYNREDNQVPANVPVHLQIINVAGEQIEVVCYYEHAEFIQNFEPVHKLTLMRLYMRDINCIGHL